MGGWVWITFDYALGLFLDQCSEITPDGTLGNLQGAKDYRLDLRTANVLHVVLLFRFLWCSSRPEYFLIFWECLVVLFPDKSVSVFMAGLWGIYVLLGIKLLLVLCKASSLSAILFLWILVSFHILKYINIEKIGKWVSGHGCGV